MKIPRDELQAGQPLLPAIFEANRDLLLEFTDGLNRACRVMLSCISATLDLPPNKSLNSYHEETESSESGLKFIAEPTLAQLSDVGDNLHTDGGTFTVVFCEKPGLQAFFPSLRQWAFIAPTEGCALVNVGNALARFSGGRLHSPQHRVTQIEDGAEERFYLSYFLRPSHKALATLVE
jgi:isopenicillin N synthase-like dioxygenase